jgi:glycosyltransferase involved in cell wall biosynthesis
MSGTALPLSVCIITLNEEANIGRTLDSVLSIAGEVIVVDCGSSDDTVAIAGARGAKVFAEPWKGFAEQKNSAIAKAGCEWILSLDADEEVSPALAEAIRIALQAPPPFDGFVVNRRNHYLGRWLKHGGFYPDSKLRLVRRELARFELRAVHESMRKVPRTSRLAGDLIHNAYPTLESFIEHANRYSTLGAGIIVDEGRGRFSVFNIALRPLARFLYAYVLRLGFLDGREGLVVHLTNAGYVSWKYAKAWELQRKRRR